MRWTILTALCVSGLALCGCSSDDNTTKPGTGGSGGTGATGGTGGTGATGGAAGSGGTAATGGAAGSGGSAGAATVSWKGTVKSYAPPTPPATAWTLEGPVAGMDVCQRGSTQGCVKTASDGTATLLGLPANSNVAVVLSHPDYMVHTVLQYVSQTADLIQAPALIATTKFDTYIAGSGCTWPGTAGKGFIYIGAPPGSKVVITPTPPTGPTYSKADGTFDPAATEISAQAPIELAAAIACGLDPGTYQVDFQGTTGTCHRAEGWPGTGHDVELVVDADSVSVTNWICQ